MKIMKRIQRKRTKGWKMPERTRYVGRGTRYGNPHKVLAREDHWIVELDNGSVIGNFLTKDKAAEYVVKVFEITLRAMDQEFVKMLLDELSDYDALCCWCSIDDPCHADVLIKLIEEIQ